MTQNQICGLVVLIGAALFIMTTLEEIKPRKGNLFLRAVKLTSLYALSLVCMAFGLYGISTL